MSHAKLPLHSLPSNAPIPIHTDMKGIISRASKARYKPSLKPNFNHPSSFIQSNHAAIYASQEIAWNWYFPFEFVLCEYILITLQDIRCLGCSFSAIRPYKPVINAIENVRHGGSSLTVDVPDVLLDIEGSNKELEILAPLYAAISRRFEQVKVDIASHKSLLSPIRRLPEDVLLSIFHHVPVNSLDPLCSPWLFGQVCAHWRSLSKSSPSLWSRIVIGPDLDKENPLMSKHNSQALYAIEQCLVMSRDHHLSIHIDTTRRQRLPEDDPSGGPSDPLHNFRPIAAASKRWSSAAFELVGARELQLFLSWISDPPEQLRTLSIFVLSGAHLGSRDVVYPPIFINSPLTHVDLENLSLLNIALSPRNLRNLRCDIRDPQQLCDLFKTFHHLKHLTISPATGRSGIIRHPWTFDGNYIVHELVELSIFVSPYHTHDHPRVALSLDALHLPQLQSLALKGPGYPFPDAAAGLFSADEMTRVRDLLNRSACSLKCLVIDSPIPVREYLSILVGPGNQLTDLSLSVNIATAPSVFRALTSGEDIPGSLIDGSFLPALTHLVLSELPGEHTEFGILNHAAVLYSMVLSRYNKVRDERRLLSLTLSIIRKSFPDIRYNFSTEAKAGFLHLLGLRKRGLDVRMLFDGKDCLEEGSDTPWVDLLDG